MAKNLNKDAVYRAAKPKENDYTINDGEGLALLVKTNGSKLWRFIYRFNGKQNRLGFGSYPDTTLENARRQADDARQKIATDIDPADIKNEARQAKQLAKLNKGRINEGLPILDSFADVTRQWLASLAHLTTATTHKKKTSRIERLAFPLLGDKPIKEIKSADVLASIKPMIEKQQLETPTGYTRKSVQSLPMPSCITLPTTIRLNQ